MFFVMLFSLVRSLVLSVLRFRARLAGSRHVTEELDLEGRRERRMTSHLDIRTAAPVVMVPVDSSPEEWSVN